MPFEGTLDRPSEGTRGLTSQHLPELFWFVTVVDSADSFVLNTASTPSINLNPRNIGREWTHLERPV